VIIPVRVPADAMPVLASERRMTILPGHPLYDELCPVCDGLLGELVTVLVFAGIEPESRKPAGWATGAAVAVHAICAGVPGVQLETPRVTVTFDITDPHRRHVLVQALEEYETRQQDMAVTDDSQEMRLEWARIAGEFRAQAEAAVANA
jgi:hypothetical protein